jgi:hypothetical protein
MNEVVQVKNVAVDGPQGPAIAMMMAVSISSMETSVEFVSTVLEQFRLQRMLAPPNTSMMLISLVGPMTAESFAYRWKELLQTDDIARVFMSQMTLAEVIQGTPQGQQLSKASLI